MKLRIQKKICDCGAKPQFFLNDECEVCRDFIAHERVEEEKFFSWRKREEWNYKEMKGE